MNRNPVAGERNPENPRVTVWGYDVTIVPRTGVAVIVPLLLALGGCGSSDADPGSRSVASDSANETASVSASGATSQSASAGYRSPVTCPDLSSLGAESAGTSNGEPPAVLACSYAVTIGGKSGPGSLVTYSVPVADARATAESRINPGGESHASFEDAPELGSGAFRFRLVQPAARELSACGLGVPSDTGSVLMVVVGKNVDADCQKDLEVIQTFAQ